MPNCLVTILIHSKLASESIRQLNVFRKPFVLVGFLPSQGVVKYGGMYFNFYNACDVHCLSLFRLRWVSSNGSSPNQCSRAFEIQQTLYCHFMLLTSFHTTAIAVAGPRDSGSPSSVTVQTG